MESKIFSSFTISYHYNQLSSSSKLETRSSLNYKCDENIDFGSVLSYLKFDSTYIKIELKKNLHKPNIDIKNNFPTHSNVRLDRYEMNRGINRLAMGLGSSR